jgi:flagellar biosynthesis chaperone FliJ
MTFRFALAALLRLRTTLEQVEERKLLSLRQDAVGCELAIEQTRAAWRNQQLRRGSATGSAGLIGADLRFSDFLQARLEFEEQQMRQTLLAKQEEVRGQLGVFINARRQREAIESLREHALEVYRENERRREQGSLDEVFLLQLWLARRNRPHG